MRNKMLCMVTGIAVMAAAVTVSAHHSFSAEFDGSKRLTLEGKVVKMEFVNPHSWLHIDVTTPDGKVDLWKVEGGSPNVMFRLGWSRDTLTPGMKVKVAGSPAKDGAKRMSSSSIEFADGKKLTTGGSNPDAPQ